MYYGIYITTIILLLSYHNNVFIAYEINIKSSDESWRGMD